MNYDILACIEDNLAIDSGVSNKDVLNVSIEDKVKFKKILPYYGFDVNYVSEDMVRGYNIGISVAICCYSDVHSRLANPCFQVLFREYVFALSELGIPIVSMPTVALSKLSGILKRYNFGNDIISCVNFEVAQGYYTGILLVREVLSSQYGF